MKRKSLPMALAAGALAIITTLAGTTAIPLKPVIVSAAEQNIAKTAALSDIKVSFDGKEPVTIQAYNIDGEYFVRVRDITNRLNMDIQACSDIAGVMIYPYSQPENSSPLEKLTEKSIKVSLAEGYIYYDGLYIKGDYFVLNDRYYYKLLDLGRSSQDRLQGAINVAKGRAKMPDPLMPTMTEFKSFSAAWNDTAKVFEVNNQITNLVKIFEEERKNYIPSAPSTPSSAVPATTTAPAAAEETHVVQPELTKAPEIGVTLAKILIDPDKGVVDGNFAYPYTIHPLRGQCTWYAIGRFYEVFGIDLINSDKGNYLAGGFKDWPERAKSADCPDIDGIPYKGNGDLSNIPNRGMAVWSKHVIFIEYVERDENGYPTMIYFTEANAGHTGEKYQNGIFYPEIDGLIGYVTPENFIYGNGTFFGFVVAK